MSFDSIVLPNSGTVHPHNGRPASSHISPAGSPVRGIVFGLALSMPFWALVAFVIFR